MYLFYPDQVYPVFSVPFEWKGMGVVCAQCLSLMKEGDV
jgi:hypothetical protein